MATDRKNTNHGRSDSSHSGKMSRSEAASKAGRAPHSCRGRECSESSSNRSSRGKSKSSY